VGIIIPTYNHGRYIEQAIASAQNQTYEPKEIIVIDDGSNDDTQARVGRFLGGVQYVRLEHRGVNAARNRGIEISRGDFLAFLDADDMWLPNKLSKQMELMQRDPCVGLVGCGGYDMDPKGNITSGPWLRADYPSRSKLLEALSIIQIIPASASGALVRRECFQAVGVFDEKLQIGEEWDMWLRLVKKYDARFVQEPLVVLRKGSSISSVMEEVDGGRVLAGPQREEFYVNKVIEKNIEGGMRKRAFAALYHRLGMWSLANAANKQALRYLMKSIRLRPLGLYPNDIEKRYHYPKDSRYYLLMKAMVPGLWITLLKKVRTRSALVSK